MRDAAVSLRLEPGLVTGRVGGATFGFDVNLEYRPDAGRLAGRLGGAFAGKDARLELEGDFPPLVAAMLAGAVVYQMHQEEHSSGSAGSQ
ncbi:MAG: hypothetical protein ACM3ZA_08315 [Bacillota bacterium]